MWADLAAPAASTRRRARQALGTRQPIWQLFFRKTCFSLCLNLCIREHSVPWTKASTVREAVAAPFVGFGTVDWDWKHKTKASSWICAPSFSSVIFLLLLAGPHQCRASVLKQRTPTAFRVACSFTALWVLQPPAFGSSHVFSFLFFFFLQLEKSFRWKRFPNFCCEAVNSQGRHRFLRENALLVSRDRKAPLTASALTVPSLPISFRELKKKRKIIIKKTPGSDSAVGISSHPFSVVSFRSVFLFL